MQHGKCLQVQNKESKSDITRKEYSTIQEIQLEKQNKTMVVV